MHPVLTNGGTSAEWALENPILPDKQIGTETDTGKKKIGNGSSFWNSLKYFNDFELHYWKNSVDASHKWGELTAKEAGIGLFYFSDVGVNGSVWYCDGDKYSPVSTVALFSCDEVLCGLPPSSTVGANGALTLGTAFDRIYPNMYLYFGAGQIYAGSAAGLYFTIMSSTTEGVIYNNVYTGGIPSVPEALAPIVDAGPGGFTQTTGTDFTLASFTVAAGLMGANGTVRPSFICSTVSSANSKSAKVFCDTVNIYSFGVTSVKTVASAELRFKNINRVDYQLSSATGSVSGEGSASSALNYSTIDTSQEFNVTFVGRLSTATEFIVFNAFYINLEY